MLLIALLKTTMLYRLYVCTYHARTHRRAYDSPRNTYDLFFSPLLSTLSLLITCALVPGEKGVRDFELFLIYHAFCTFMIYTYVFRLEFFTLVTSSEIHGWILTHVPEFMYVYVCLLVIRVYNMLYIKHVTVKLSDIFYM